MCGVFAVVGKRGHELNFAECRRALSKLGRRGPDASTTYIYDNRVFLGQTILSVTGDITKSTGEHLRSSTGRFRLAYNGEVYNYRALGLQWLNGKQNRSWETDGWTVVNLHEVLPIHKIPLLLDGMFSYALLDTQKNTLSICRDLQGEKALYVFEDEEMVIVSSGIAAILDLKPSISLDKQAMRDYFRTRHFMFIERTIFSGIRQLLPGHIETLKLDSMEWSAKTFQNLYDLIDPEKAEQYSRYSDESLVDELDSLLASSIKQMIPDRQYSSVVSGGVDSSLISSYLVKHGNPDLLVAVDHVGKDRISSDLSGFEKVFKRQIDVIKMDLLDYTAEVERCQMASGSPLFSHSLVGQSVQSAFVRRRDSCVLFGGDCADELFGGYGCYLDQRNQNGRFSPSFYTRHYEPELCFPEDDPTPFQNDLSKAWSESLATYAHIKDAEERVVQAMMYCDAAFQLSSVSLRGTDLMSMMWSVESRCVFIRKPIIQFALNLPARLKSNPLEKNPLLRAKPLLKRLFLRYFPSELLVEKQGFAGFPNESGKYLGEMKDFLVLEVLRIEPEFIQKQKLSRETEWKLINLEFFLRNNHAHL